MDKPLCSPSHACSGEPPVDCNDTALGLVDTKVQGKTGKKKKKKQKKRQSATSQMKTASECSQVSVEQSSSSQHLPEHLENRSAGSKHKKNTRKTRNQSISPATSPASFSHQDKPQSAQQTSAGFTCDQSTQTEASQLQSVQTVNTNPSDPGHTHASNILLQVHPDKTVEFFLATGILGKIFHRPFS